MPRKDKNDTVTVVWTSRRWATVLRQDGELEKVKIARGVRAVVGDRGQLVRDKRGATIEEVMPRSSQLERRASGRVHGQLMAANVDALGIVTAIGQFKPGLVDRLLVASAVGGVEPLLVINKVDLQDLEAMTEEDLLAMIPEELLEEGEGVEDLVGALAWIEETADYYRSIGVPVVFTSALEGTGLDELSDLLRGRTVALAGHSGVGKSSLLNALVPNAGQDVGEISGATGLGRHVTSSSRGVPYEDGGLIIDMPGVRLFGMLALEPVELLSGFAELTPFADGCRFPNCTHSHEPECTVRAAVDEGKAPEWRYASYLRLLDEVQEVAAGRVPQ